MILEQSYLRMYWTDFHHYFHHMIRNLIGHHSSDFLFPVTQGTLPWQPIKCWDWLLTVERDAKYCAEYRVCMFFALPLA